MHPIYHLVVISIERKSFLIDLTMSWIDFWWSDNLICRPCIIIILRWKLYYTCNPLNNKFVFFFIEKESNKYLSYIVLLVSILPESLYLIQSLNRNKLWLKIRLHLYDKNMQIKKKKLCEEFFFFRSEIVVDNLIYLKLFCYCTTLDYMCPKYYFSFV